MRERTKTGNTSLSTCIDRGDDGRTLFLEVCCPDVTNNSMELQESIRLLRTSHFYLVVVAGVLQTRMQTGGVSGILAPEFFRALIQFKLY